MSEANFETMRAAMVSNQLRTSAVSDAPVVEAMRAVPREAFMPAGRADLAYIDTPVAVGEGRSINPPLVTGRLLTALAPRAGERALVVGAATGYAAAVLAELGLVVTALEENATLAAFAEAALAKAGVRVVNGPLAAGVAEAAPYDVILIDGAVEQVPGALTAQLADGGRMAGALVERGVTRLASGRKVGDSLVLADFADSEAVALPGFAVPAGFVF
ncbi:protein-L-isoaspartate O-methyltransferase family protein [Sphingomonas colocasiae]|uniref:Protein-L-isoaspartate O-methyltransferase n=1 Tax=Sphingomonas colocasiae TaxID=1848973 RepID=A0ABS7PKK9_9SPHN|nr:protein-L-isoaspartate O-methyltransferase [Sphingomonas colocasiae]MBY8821827.1 protein-L-isoaspartate O-methyltransferase [Sphingomonas colocasiae]